MYFIDCTYLQLVKLWFSCGYKLEVVAIKKGYFDSIAAAVLSSLVYNSEMI